MQTGQPEIQTAFNIAKDLPVNRMGFGAMRITGKGVWGPPQDLEECIRVLKRTQELGINFIDTADSYGPNVSEELIAQALYPYPDDLVIATKGGLMRTGPDQWPINAHPDYLRKALEGSLKRLKKTQIQLYQLHRPDAQVPFADSLAFLRDAQRQGLIKHIGLSEVSLEQIKKAQDIFEVASVQNKYSIDYRKWERVLEYCQANHIAFIPWYPLNAGNVRSMDKLTQIGKRYNASPHQVALGWLFQRADNILLIPGTSKVQHLEENFRAQDVRLSDEDLQELERLFPTEK
jgi:pyridoxine 4-dehydrogenase